jgi:nonsense-mediated mRNA decay protein 3
LSFCVKCGRDCEESLNGLCIDCWLDGRKLTSLPHHIDLRVCTNCGEFAFGDRWVKRDLAIAVQETAMDNVMALRDVTVTGMAADVECQDPYVYVVTVTCECDVMGYVTEDVSSTIVRIKNNVCKRCSRQLGSYYEAILQIRTGAKELSPEMREETLAMVENSVARQAATNRSLFITKMEIVTGGVDVYLSSMSLGKSLARELSDAYCAETKESPKLVGQTSDGQDMYRITYLVRLPAFHVGDVVIHEGRYCKLLRVSGSGGRVIDLMNFRERAVRKADMPDLKLYESAEDLREATVISSSGDEIQIMHPDNYSTVDLKVPEGYEVGDTVRVVPIDDILYMVPRSGPARTHLL